MRTTLRITGLISLMARVSPGLGAAVNCTTHQEKTLSRLQMLCSEGTRATSHWNAILDRWETTVQPAPSARQACTTRMHPQMKHLEVRCQEGAGHESRVIARSTY